MAVIPLTVRRTLLAEHSDEVEIALVTFTHPDLAAPIRLSSDPTERFSVDPLRYGTTSRGQQFEHILMSAIVPDDQRGVPPRLALVLDNVAVEMVETLRSFSEPATAVVEFVLASAPDALYQKFARLQTTRVAYDAESITIDLAREPFVSEPFGQRQIKHFFPGLFGLPSA